MPLSAKNEATCVHRRLSPALWSDAPVGFQMAGTIVMGAAIFGGAWLAAPSITAQVIQFFAAGLRQLGHAATAIVQGGAIHEIFTAHQVSHVEFDTFDEVAVAVVGMLIVPLMATIAVVAALCRWGLQVWLALFGGVSCVLGLATDDLIVRWTLLPWGAVLCVVAVLPLYEALRAAFLIVVGLALLKATIDDLPNLAAREILLPDGQVTWSATYQISRLLGQDMGEVRAVLVSTMVILAVSGACMVGRFLLIHGGSR